VDAALRTLVHVAAGRQSWAVLGEMLELGPQSRQEHRQIGDLAVRLGVDRLVVVGPGAAPIAGGALDAGLPRQRLALAGAPEQVFDLLAEARTGPSTILIKGSLGTGLWRVATGVAGG
jgi:UDP-N-acetylmuramoyl-tripeptide--D-alanyl-D-alanine ligase